MTDGRLARALACRRDWSAPWLRDWARYPIVQELFHGSSGPTGPSARGDGPSGHFWALRYLWWVALLHPLEGLASER